jgi:mRNA-degrading endonuclease YafQ of YafQ-DinJ toxin-antitoxin module
MKVIQKQSFGKSVKKLHANQKASLDEAIRMLCENPLGGELKKGDLAGVRVYKFQMVSLMALLAYQYDAQKEELILLKIASHENFYRDLKEQF